MVQGRQSSLWKAGRYIFGCCVTLCVFGLSVAHAQDEPPAAGEQAEEQQEPAAAPVVQKRPELLILPTESVNGKLTRLVPERIDESMRVRLKDDGKVVVMPGFVEIRKKLAGQGVSSAVIYEAEQLYTSGIGLLTAGNNEQAMGAFQRSLELQEQNLADVTNYNILTDTISNLALAYHLMGYDVDSRKKMQQFAHIRPEATLSPDKFPKELIEVFESEQKKIKKAGPGKLVISTETPGAQVFIDGKDRGVTPVTLDDVGFGYHYLVIKDGKGNVHTEQLRVRGKKKEQQVNANLSSAGNVAATSGDEMPVYYTDLLASIKTGEINSVELQPYLAELSKQSGAPYIAWVLVYKTGTNYMAAPFIWRAKDNMLVMVEERKFNMEMTDLVLGVNKMAKSMAVIAQDMPEDNKVTSVTVGAAPVVVATNPVTTTGTTGTTGTTTTTSPVIVTPPSDGTDTTGDQTQTLKPLDPIEEEDPKDSKRRWKYVGIGAAAVAVVGGLVVGGVMLANDDDEQPTTNTDFSAEVSW